MELKTFLDVDNAVAANSSSSEVSTSPASAERSQEDDSNGARRRASATRTNTRRLSAKPSAIGFDAEASSGGAVTAPPKPNTSAPARNLSPAPESHQSSAPTPVAAVAPPAAPAAPAMSMSAVMQENLGKYNKMKSMLPEGAVRQRMGADGCTDNEIDAFFGAATPAPAPAAKPVAAAPSKAAAPASKPAAAPPSAKAPATPAANVKIEGAPPKTAARANLLASIAARRIE
jgi:hypothetical protein